VVLHCPSCKAELSPALIGAEGRCPYCGTKAATAASVEPPARQAPSRPQAVVDTDETEKQPRVTRPPGAPVGAIGDSPLPLSTAETMPKTAAVSTALPRGWGGLAVGARGILHGKATLIRGRVRFQVERPRMAAWWDVWLVQYGEGGDGWLCDREGALTILRPFKPTSEVTFEELREGMLVRLDAGSPATVIDVGTAIVRGSEGESEWEPGGKVRFAVLAGDGWRYHLQWWKGLEAFRGEGLESSMLAAGFGLRAPSGLRDSAVATVDTFSNLPQPMQILLIIMAIPVLVGIAVWVASGAIIKLIFG
jgi:hypothetical protein